MPAKVIVKEPQDCVHCQYPLKIIAEPGRNFECPYCAHSFCVNCFVPIYDGDGHTVKCPHCQEVLFLTYYYMV